MITARGNESHLIRESFFNFKSQNVAIKVKRLIKISDFEMNMSYSGIRWDDVFFSHVKKNIFTANNSKCVGKFPQPGDYWALAVEIIIYEASF